MSRKLGLRNYRGQYIDTANPVNRQHPLNRGRVAWWLGLPGKTGGNQFYDLMGLNPGTLTSMGNSSNGWRNNNYPGALGQSLLFDGSAGTVSLPASSAFNLNSWTVNSWINPTSSSTGYNIIICRGNGTYRTFEMDVRTPNGYGALVFTQGPSTYRQINGNTAIPSGAWTMLTGTYTSGMMCLYVNGILDSSSTAFTGNPDTLNEVFNLGTDTSGDFFNGLIGEVKIFNRAWPASEVQQNYILSRQGYPGVINRVTSMLPDLYNQPSGGSSIVFRKSLAQYGTRVGTRQMQGAR